MFSHLLLATDGSEHSHRAADKAIELASLSTDASIEIIYVVDGNTSKSDVLHYGDSQMASRKREEMLSVFKEKIEQAGIPARVTILHGIPAETIIEYANHHPFDCLIVGSRGRSRVQTMILGSVSHKVIKHVNLPVLMVK
ncbi:Nucleotide-binding universal stress protein, UspA family [Evansella caseinilytica]|uniref:Nucleotide-binding universal stress protein, UspA family n=1 Tax=Evansella caseinilytica TaxID=1503961 RepID=A0A1H3UR91_9BACI|nr:universal stress protein [Evansella caseinilytica]SDZ64551.1 Nucleotide-binding universal stress protein, UspA family [Evansella caseinilytica]